MSRTFREDTIQHIARSAVVVLMVVAAMAASMLAVPHAEKVYAARDIEWGSYQNSADNNGVTDRDDRLGYITYLCWASVDPFAYLGDVPYSTHDADGYIQLNLLNEQAVTLAEKVVSFFHQPGSLFRLESDYSGAVFKEGLVTNKILEFIGDGADYATAFFGSAKMVESFGGLTTYDDSEDWNHINFFTVKCNLRILCKNDVVSVLQRLPIWKTCQSLTAKDNSVSCGYLSEPLLIRWNADQQTIFISNCPVIVYCCY